MDARRGQPFTKLARAITVAAREGGGDTDGNPSLALAVQKARDASMPKDNIERAIATMTVVRPRLPFGLAELNGDGVVRGFSEKPRSEHWVNGGFFCFEPAVLDVLGPESVLEREPLERLAAHGQLRAFRHHGFWECMDTYKDAVELNDLWASGRAPWLAGARHGCRAEPVPGMSSAARPQ